MTPSEVLVRSVLGPCRKKIRPFACAIDCVIQHSFAIEEPIEDILVTKDIYPEVAKLLHMSPESAARQIERISNDCWNLGDRERLNRILGGAFPDCPTPRDMLFYFAAYTYFGVPFRQAMDRKFANLF